MAEKLETELARLAKRMQADKARHDEIILLLKERGHSLSYIESYTTITRSGVAQVVQRMRARQET